MGSEWSNPWSWIIFWFCLVPRDVFTLLLCACLKSFDLVAISCIVLYTNGVDDVDMVCNGDNDTDARSYK